MPKYRNLTQEELSALEKEFVDFLVINGITADEWESLKKKQTAKAEKIIEQFSDVVWEGVLRKTEFLEHQSSQEIRTFQCLPGKIILMGLEINDQSVDLRTAEGIEKVKKNIPSTAVYTSEKVYSNKREEELFALIQSGAQISDGKLYKSIALMVAEKER